MFCLQENEIKIFNEKFIPPRSTYRLHNIPQGQYAIIAYNSQKFGEFYNRIYYSTIKKIQFYMKFFEKFWMRKVSRF